MAIIRRRSRNEWDPLSWLSDFRDEIDNYFVNSLAPRKSAGTDLWQGDWLPAVDVLEDKEKITVKADLPGLKKDEIDISLNGRLLTEAATGVGPVDAAMKAIRKAVSAVEPIRLEEYHVEAITGGTDAVVEVIVRLRKGDRVVTAMGVHGDIVMASVEAMLSGMNLLMNGRVR